MTEREFSFGSVVRIKNDPNEDHNEVVFILKENSAHTLPITQEGISPFGGGIEYVDLIPTGKTLTAEEIFQSIIDFDQETGNNIYSSKEKREELLHQMQEFASHSPVRIDIP